MSDYLTTNQLTVLQPIHFMYVLRFCVSQAFFIQLRIQQVFNANISHHSHDTNGHACLVRQWNIIHTGCFVSSKVTAAEVYHGSRIEICKLDLLHLLSAINRMFKYLRNRWISCSYLERNKVTYRIFIRLKHEQTMYTQWFLEIYTLGIENVISYVLPFL